MKLPENVLRSLPVVLGVGIGAALALSVHGIMPKTYESTVTLFLGSPASTDSSGAYNGDMFSQQRAASYAELLSGRNLAVKVIDDLGLDTTPDALSATVSANRVPQTVLMQVTASGNDAEQAAQVANAYAANFITFIGRLEVPIGSYQPNTAVTIVERAEPPIATASPGAAAFAMGGAAVGGFLTLFILWLVRKFDRTVRTADQAESVCGTEVVGVLPAIPAAAERPLDPRTGASSKSSRPYWEAIYCLRTHLTGRDGGSVAKSIALVAPRSTMSTTVTATHLAMAFSGIGRKVALVDADLRQSRLTRYLDSYSDSGLVAAIAGTVAVDEVTTSSTVRRIDMVPAGRSTVAPSDVLASDGTAKVIAELCAGHDVVLCDTPGLLDATDASVVGQDCDAVVLVVTYGRTRIDDLRRVTRTLRRLGVEPLGVVLCGMR
ncbi:polysaccharide biosynthesis tyrosine autokinase [soil metagenome]